MRSSSYPLRPRPGTRARAALTAVLAGLVAALCLTGLAAPPASAQPSPPTDIALAWGRNLFGQLGDGTNTNSSTPVNVHLPTGVELTEISAGSYHSLGLTSDGRVLAWGFNDWGQLGDGTHTNRNTPVEVHLPAGTRVAAIAAGYQHSMALTSDGRVFAWGDNALGQLGDGTNTERTTPVEVHLPAGIQVTAITGGIFHNLALTSDGRLLAWGNNEGGQLGDGTTTNRPTPVYVDFPAGSQITAFAAGGQSLALTSDGRLLAWGSNYYGTLGDGTNINRTTPVEVHLPSGIQVTAIAAGGYHSMAVTSDGRVLAWGWNEFGQVGDGTTTNRNTPVYVDLPAGIHVTIVAGGYQHSLAVTSDGRGLAWGVNVYGELGDGTTTDRLTPVNVDLPTGVHLTAVSGGIQHSLALAARAESATTLTASPTTAAPGQPVTLSAHVTCTTGTPTGTVEFFDGTTVIGTATLDAQGNATLTTTNLALGARQITAQYQGGGGCPPSASTPVTVIVQEAPVESLTLSKQVASAGPFKVGDTVNYSYTVANTGNTTLNNVTVADNLVTGVTCDATTLPPGQTTTCHGTHTITQADITPCQPTQGGCALTNLAQATAFTPTGQEVASEQAKATITVQQATELTLSKRVDSRGPFHVGDTVSYAYTVTNTSTTDLTSAAVKDNLVTGVTCDTTTLAPGQTTTCHGTHTITQADITPCRPTQGGCALTNLAQATATEPAGNQVTSNQATATITVQAPVAELSLQKRVVSKGPFRVGDQVRYAYTVTNTSTTTLTNVTVTDNLVAGVTCATTTLTPGASTTCTGSQTITKADVTPCKTGKERGGHHGKGKHQVMRCQVTNTAQATATDPNGNQATSNQATATITVKVKKKEEEHCRKHHGGHRKDYGSDDCHDHGSHHHRAAGQA